MIFLDNKHENSTMIKVKVIPFLISTVFVSGLFAESVYDGTSSLINANNNTWGGNKDEVRMQPHANINKTSTVTFQVLYDATKCTHIDISSKFNLQQDVLINTRSWNKEEVEESYKVELPLSQGISIELKNLWTLVSIQTTKPIEKMHPIFAYCRGVDNPLNLNGVTKIPTSETRLGENSRHGGNSSIIYGIGDNGRKGYGVNKDEFITLSSHDSEAMFQVYSNKESCNEITIKDLSNSSKFDDIQVKGWSEEKWRSFDTCQSLPCKIPLYFGKDNKPTYTLIKVKTKAGENGTLRAYCGVESKEFNLKEKEFKVTHPNNCKFNDVTNDKYIIAMCSAGILEGYGNTGYTKFGPNESTLWSELIKVVNLSKSYYKTKKITKEYNGNTWYDAYLHIAEKQGFDYSFDKKIKIGFASKYIIKIFWNKELSESEALFFLNRKNIGLGLNSNNLLFRKDMAKIILQSAKKSAEEQGVEAKLPYINHSVNDLDIKKDDDLPENVFNKISLTSTIEEKLSSINKNIKTVQYEKDTVSDEGYTNNTGLTKAILGGEEALSLEYQNKSAEKIVEKAKEEGVATLIDDGTKLKDNSLVELTTPSFETILVPTVPSNEKDTVLIEKNSGNPSIESLDTLTKQGFEIESQIETKDILAKDTEPIVIPVHPPTTIPIPTTPPIVNMPPIANAGVDKTVGVNQYVLLDASKSTDSDGRIVSVMWYRGTTFLGMGEKFNYKPTKVGTEILTVKVTDNDRATATDTVRVTAFNDIAPKLTAVFPSKIQVGSRNINLYIYGNNLKKVSKVFIAGAVNTTSFISISDTRIIVNIPEVYEGSVDVPYGLRDIVAIVDGKRVYLKQKLYVQE